MPTENTDTTSQGIVVESTTAPQPETPPAEKTYTQADLDAERQKARDAAFAEARRTFEGKPPKQPKAAKEESAAQAPDPTLDTLRYMEAASGVKLPTQQARTRMLQELVAAKPEDAHAWVKSWANDMGYAQSEEAAAAPAAKPQPQNARPASDAGAPVVNTQGARPVDVLNWTSEDVEAYFRQHAKVPANRYDVRNREVWRALRRMTEASLADKRIYVGPPKR